METLVIRETCEGADGQIQLLTLNRPAKRNALTIELMQSLHTELQACEADASCRAVILRGAGPVFCAGLDLREAAELEVAQKSAEWVAKTFQRFATTDLVVIAAVHGAAMAGGAGLMSSCDLVVAESDARIGFPEVRRGLVAALVSAVLKRRLRDSEMRMLFLTGEAIDATRACQLGLVQQVGDDALAQATELARTICQGGPSAVRHTKRLIRDLGSLELDLQTALAAHSAARTSAEAAEGLAAFLEKRDANW